MKLHELRFEANVPFEWVRRDAKQWRADFVIDDHKYFVDFYTGNWDTLPLWMFQFGMYRADKTASTMAMTGARTPFRVLSTVREVFDDFYRSVHPHALGFYDGDRTPSRMRMYDKFAHYVAEHYGYQFEEALMQKAMRTVGSKTPGNFVWILTKPSTRP